MQNSSIRICNADDSSLSIHNGMRTSCLHLLWGLGVIHLCMDHVKARLLLSYRAHFYSLGSRSPWHDGSNVIADLLSCDMQ